MSQLSALKRGVNSPAYAKLTPCARSHEVSIISRQNTEVLTVKDSIDAIGVPEEDRQTRLIQWTTSSPWILHHSLAPSTALTNRFDRELHTELCMVIQAQRIVLLDGSGGGHVTAMQKLFECVRRIGSGGHSIEYTTLPDSLSEADRAEVIHRRDVLHLSSQLATQGS